MIKVAFSLNESVINDVEKELSRVAAKELSGCENLLRTSYLDGDVTCNLTVDDKQARFTIAGTEGVFKDVFLPLNRSVRLCVGENYDFLCSLEKKVIFILKKDSYTEGSQEELIGILQARSGEMTETEIALQKAHQEAIERNEQRKNAEKFFGSKESAGNLPQYAPRKGDRFKVQKYFAIAFAIFGMLDSMDGMFFGRGQFDPMNMLRSGLIGLVSGFFISFAYTFFRAWFDGQKENVKVGSIALFFITFPAFAVMGVLGAIPYSVYQLFDGKRNRSVTKVINVAVPIFMGLVLILELGLLYLVFGLGMFS